MIVIYGLKNCDSCRAALKALKGVKQGVELVDIRADAIDDALLAQAIAQFGDALVNRRSTTWRGLDEDTRNAEALTLLRAYPALMKRPLIAGDGPMTLGWDQKVREHYLGNG